MNDPTPDVTKLSAIEAISTASRLAGERGGDPIALYREWLSAHPEDRLGYAVAFNLGVLLKDAGQEEESERSYRKAIELNPACLDAQFNLGSQLERLGRQQEAVQQWRSILDNWKEALPENRKIFLLTLNNLGRLQENLRNYPEAEAYLTQSLEIDPEQPDVMQHLIYIRQRQCAWPAYPEIPGVDKEALRRATGPLSLLALSDDPAEQLERMQRYSQEKVFHPESSLSDGRPYGHKRLRVAYLSSDYCLHPVSMLTVELFELHDRNRFETYGFCWSRDDGSALRKRVISAFDHYIPLGGRSDEDVAHLIRSHEIDILVDLHGLTLGARPAILGWRPAPIQVTYLGFPGTTGIPGVDYVIADRFVLPESTARNFSETPLYLSHCFQVSDRKKDVGPTPTRQEYGLPENAFVFCSFNNNYKFTLEVFTSWMRIVKAVPGSVMWLLADNVKARENLMQFAEAAGVARERIIFAERVAPANYLSRYQVADLFLDNRPFGAGTTASDALSQGLPILTCPGETFASRMAGSMLNTLGLGELIAESPESYERLAIEIGNDPERANAIKTYLRARVKHSPLFDVPRTVKEIERKYIELAERLAQGRQPVHRVVDSAQKQPLRLGDFIGNYAATEKPRNGIVEVISATRMDAQAFWTNSALGQSLRRLTYETRLRPNITFENSRGLPEVFNERIQSASEADILLFVHDDVWIDDFYIVDRLLAGLSVYDVVGIAGNKRCHDDQPTWAFIDDNHMEEARYLAGVVGHGAQPCGELTPFGAASAECAMLDGVFLAAWRRGLQESGVRFDPRFSFHFYDMDFCRSATESGLRLGVWPICITHQSEGNFQSQSWLAGREIYRRKWFSQREE